MFVWFWGVTGVHHIVHSYCTSTVWSQNDNATEWKKQCWERLCYINTQVAERYLICKWWTTAFQWDSERARDLVWLRRWIRHYYGRTWTVTLELSHYFAFPFTVLLLFWRKTWLCDDDTSLTYHHHHHQHHYVNTMFTTTTTTTTTITIITITIYQHQYHHHHLKMLLTDNWT